MNCSHYCFIGQGPLLYPSLSQLHSFVLRVGFHRDAIWSPVRTCHNGCLASYIILVPWLGRRGEASSSRKLPFKDSEVLSWPKAVHRAGVCSHTTPLEISSTPISQFSVATATDALQQHISVPLTLPFPSGTCALFTQLGGWLPGLPLECKLANPAAQWEGKQCEKNFTCSSGPYSFTRLEVLRKTSKRRAPPPRQCELWCKKWECGPDLH